MDFELTEEQRAVQGAVCGIAERHLAADNLKRTHEPGYPLNIACLFADHGLMDITLPEEDGGQGGSFMDAVLAIEQVALVCPRSADVIQSGSPSLGHKHEAKQVPEKH
jgi:alkylation response protein AidB-like acyl-CoA dehydrogenase